MRIICGHILKISLEKSIKLNIQILLLYLESYLINQIYINLSYALIQI